MKKYLPKIIVFILIALVFTLAKSYGFTDYLTLDYLKENQARFQEFYQINKLQTLSIYMLIYILAAAFSLPGATILTLAGGALFGFSVGLLSVSFASTIGATLSFLAARFLLRDSIQEKFGNKLKTFNQGIEKDGAFYLFTLRLIPLFPFFVINLLMGLTTIKTITFAIVSQVGMLLGTAVYVNAGSQISQINSLKEILSPSLIFSFALLGILPFIAKFFVEKLKAKKVYKRFKRPSKFDYNMVAIGGGSAGLVTTYIAAAVKAKVALIEKNKMGGDCLNTGCVPSKALIKSATVIQTAKNSKKYGIDAIDVHFDFSKIMERVQDVIKKIEPHDSIERYEGLGVECITGAAKILSPWEIEVNGKVITTQNITIATGARPFVPPILGLENVEYLTSDNLWQLRELPKNFIVLGAGPIGLELAQCFNRFGSNVSIIEMGERVLSIEDPEVSTFIEKKLISEGVHVLTGHKAKEFKKDSLICEHNAQDVEIPFDKVLIAVGRKANVSGFGLEELGVSLRKNGTIEADEFLRTNYPNIFVCGDVTGPFQLTHTAAHQAWFCAVNGLFGKFKKFKVDYSVIPWCTYLDPEVATVGMNEQTAKKEGVSYEVTTYGIDDLDRAIADSEDQGFVKVLTAKGTDRVIGATIVGKSASDLLLEFIGAMKHGYGLNKILGTIHIYPTMGEANKYLAGNWKKERTPVKLLTYIQKYFAWTRGD
jgi:dihydrolipoamide dehydrogenase